MRQSPKVIGKTGGIYHPDPKDMSDFLKTIEIAVDNGSGGDGQENDVEAIAEGIKAYKNFNEVVLIADNSPVRDISLVKNINKPVHVILYDGGWVPDYIKIAYETGGSITTLKDYISFAHNKNISTVQLNGISYDLASL